jgi:hypothetical protein
MEFNLDQAMPVLERTPRVLRALLAGLPEAWVRAHEGGETWSPFDVLGHLIHGERTDWIPRAQIILQHGAARTFESFDRFAQFEASRGQSPGELLDTFEELRRENLERLRGLGLRAEDMARKGKHPELGEVTLGQLLATWAAHDLSHVAQVAEAMARQYRDAVGAWRAYLPVLDR